MLDEDHFDDLQMVADKLWAIHAHQQHSTIAAVEPATVEPVAIAAVKGGSPSKPS